MFMGAVHVWPTHLEYVERISSVKGTAAFALIFGKEPNGYQDFSNEQTGTFNQHYLVRPAIEQRVNIAQLILQNNFNSTRNTRWWFFI
jgi:two-component SAPR family response regulator